MANDAPIPDDEKDCLVCDGSGHVDGADHYDWQDDEYYDHMTPCTSCGGSGKAKDMTWC